MNKCGVRVPGSPIQPGFASRALPESERTALLRRRVSSGSFEGGVAPGGSHEISPYNKRAQTRRSSWAESAQTDSEQEPKNILSRLEVGDPRKRRREDSAGKGDRSDASLPSLMRQTRVSNQIVDGHHKTNAFHG